MGIDKQGVAAIELNLSCPNLEDGHMFSFNADASASVVRAANAATDVPIGAKLSPNTPEIVDVALACVEAGADFLVLTNTAYGFGLDLASATPLLSGGVGGYSGPGLKPVSLRCLYEVAKASPGVDLVGCGGVTSGADVAEYLMAGASAVEVGTALLADPDAGTRILAETSEMVEGLGFGGVADLIGAALR